METNVTVSRTKIVLMWGAILGLALFGMSFIDTLLKGATAWGITSFLLKVLIFVSCMGMSIKQWRDKALGGYINYGKAFVQALLTGLFATVLLTLVTFVSISVGSDDYQKELSIQKTEELAKLEDQGADENAIEITEKIFDLLLDPTVISAIIFVAFIIGSVIMALIVAAIYKKDDPNNFGMA